MEWVKCSERMPEEGSENQVYCSDTEEQFTGIYVGNGEFQYAAYGMNIIVCTPTHWMPLPPPPTE